MGLLYLRVYTVLLAATGAWCWFVVRENYCWMAGGWCWFDVREKYCWLAGKAASKTECI